MTGGTGINLILQEQTGAITIPSSGVVIGRSSSCFLRVDDPAVSRRHLRIFFEDAPMIEDLGSSNGTLINGARLVGRRVLAEGDEISIGNRCFTVRFVAEDLGSQESEITEPDTLVPGSGTRMGLGAVGGVELSETCPRCGQTVLVGKGRCTSCGFSWPKAAPRSTTTPRAPALAPGQHEEHRAIDLKARYSSRSLDTVGEVRSVSARSAFFACSEFDRIGRNCQLHVLLEGGKVVQLDGFVQHIIRRGVDSTGMGIEFTKLTPSSEQWLREVLGGDD